MGMVRTWQDVVRESEDCCWCCVTRPPSPGCGTAGWRWWLGGEFGVLADEAVENDPALFVGSSCFLFARRQGSKWGRMVPVVPPPPPLIAGPCVFQAEDPPAALPH